MFSLSFSLYSLTHPLEGDLGTIPHLDIDGRSVIGRRRGCASWAMHKSDCRDRTTDQTISSGVAAGWRRNTEC